MTVLLFWSAVSILFYIVALFPVLVIIRGILFPKSYTCKNVTPKVSLIIAAYNEKQVMDARIKNILSLDYPKEQLQVIIASDGSSDRTVDIASRFTNDGIQVLDLPRQGKHAALNAAIATASGEILVFSDANTMLAKDALRKLVMPFADGKIGGVAGRQVYQVQFPVEASAEGEKKYWEFDQFIKAFQTKAGNVTSAHGSLYAIRRALYQNVPPGVPDDFLISTRVVAQGYRLVYEPNAVSFEPVASTSSAEFSRKERIITQGLYAVFLVRELLNPMRFGFYSIQLFSHKVLRRLVYFPLILIFFTSIRLWDEGILYLLAAVGQVGFYSLALFGFLLHRKPLGHLKIFSIPFYFCGTYLASMKATINLFRRKRVSIWETTRQDSASVSNI